MSDRSREYRPRNQPSHPGQLSLAIPPWVSNMCRLVKVTDKEETASYS